NGPYHLGGWSMGGAIAFEMARRLRAAGEEVALLAMLDVGAPRYALAGAAGGGVGRSFGRRPRAAPRSLPAQLSRVARLRAGALRRTDNPVCSGGGTGARRRFVLARARPGGGDRQRLRRPLHAARRSASGTRGAGDRSPGRGSDSFRKEPGMKLEE